MKRSAVEGSANQPHLQHVSQEYGLSVQPAHDSSAAPAYQQDALSLFPGANPADSLQLNLTPIPNKFSYENRAKYSFARLKPEETTTHKHKEEPKPSSQSEPPKQASPELD